MKLFLLFLSIFLANFSFAMEEYQEGDGASYTVYPLMTDEEQLLFPALIDMIERSQMFLANPDFVPAINSDDTLREKLSTRIREQISTVDQCLAINLIYQQITQKKDINVILYMVHKENINYGYEQAIRMYNSGYHIIAIEWALQAMNDIEAAFVHLAEKKQNEDALKEADEINTMIETTFLNKIYVYYPTPLCNCRECTNY